MSNLRPGITTTSIDARVQTLLKTLRLLDVDKLQGWTDISVEVLCSRSAGPSQKRRIESAEWILYHLFTIWDKTMTLEVIQPSRLLVSLLIIFPEIETILSILRVHPVYKPTRCAVQMAESVERRWSLGKRCDVAEDYV